MKATDEKESLHQHTATPKPLIEIIENDNAPLVEEINENGRTIIVDHDNKVIKEKPSNKYESKIICVDSIDEKTDTNIVQSINNDEFDKNGIQEIRNDNISFNTVQQVDNDAVNESKERKDIEKNKKDDSDKNKNDAGDSNGKGKSIKYRIIFMNIK